MGVREWMEDAARRKVAQLTRELAVAQPNTRRRIENSLALATSKLLCPHLNIEVKNFVSSNKNVQMMNTARCPDCKLSINYRTVHQKP